MVFTKRLHLHVGYGKTGSSYLQAWLGAHAADLACQGVYYPLSAEGHGDSGNGDLLLRAMAQPDAGAPGWLKGPAERWLFSREQLARELAQPATCRQLVEWAEHQGFTTIEALLFVRDPLQHCYSLWAQKVKRAGERRSFEIFAESYDGIRMATRFVQAAQDSGMRVCIRDYGRWRQQLLELMLQWLGLEPGDLVRLCGDDHGQLPTTKLVNPTPSYAQLRLLRRFNHWRPHHLVGTVLVPPVWLAGLLPRRQPGSVNECVLRRWRDELEEFNATAMTSGEHSECMPRWQE